MASGVSVRELGTDTAGWSDYVGGLPGASIYHGIEWREIIERSFGHTPRYLVAEENGAVCGVLPLFEMRSRLFGHFFVSLPFLNYGGVLADTPDAERELTDAAVALAKTRGASHIELRQAFARRELVDGWILRQHKAALMIDLRNGSKPLWDGLSSRLRGKVRKAEKNGTVFAAGGKEELSDFYHLYALNMRDLGTPVYDPAFFKNVVDLSRAQATVLVVRREGRPAAAAIALRKGDRIELPWICQNYAEASLNVNEYVYWKAIEWACEQGARDLDLGRSSIDAGTYRFKMQWNPEPQVLNWYYWTAPGTPLPQMNPDNPKYGLAVKVWKKLPLAVANRIGPSIVRNIP